MDIFKEFSNTQKEEPNELLLNDKHSDNLASNPDNPDALYQREETSDIILNGSQIIQNSSTISDETNQDVKLDFDTFSEGQVFRKYSLREVRSVIKPFQHKIKMRERCVKSEKNEEPPEDVDHMCKLCCRMFKTYSKYINHLRQHSSTASIYTCAQCDETFSTNKELWDHKFECHNEANCFLCQKCEVAFSDHYTYLLHTVRHMKKPYQCPECHVTSIEYKSLAAHLRTHFNPIMKCHVCHIEIRQKRMQLHLKTHQDHQDSIKCVECGKVYKDNKSYKYHLNSHTGVKPHQCLYCGKAFSTSSSLKVHTMLHTGIKPFQCNQCHRQFRQVTDLKRHKEGHETEGKYECDYCQKKFKGKENLKYHIRSHTNYKPYKCPNCKRSFTTLVHLRAHIRHIHFVVKEYICEVCTVGFHAHHHYLRHLNSKRHLQNAFCKENKEATEE